MIFCKVFKYIEGNTIFVILQENNNKFLEILTGVPNKSFYFFHDLERSAAYYQVLIEKNITSF